MSSDRAYFETLDDDAVIEELTTIKGVGEWTARMLLPAPATDTDCIYAQSEIPIQRRGTLYCS